MAGLIGGSSGKTLRVQEFRTSGTFTVPSGVKTVELFMVGGGGGTSASGYKAGQGGNVLEVNYDVSGKASCAVVIGAGGSNTGGAGGSTSFDGVVVSNGGAGDGAASCSIEPTQHSGTPVSGRAGFGGNGVHNSTNGCYRAPGNGAYANSDGTTNTGAGASGAGKAGGSGYLRVEWYE